MKKTLLSIMAAAGLIASASALADSSLVEIYGAFNVDFENVKATGTTAKGFASPGCPNFTCQMTGGIVSGAAGVAGASVGANVPAVNGAPAQQPSGNVSPSRNRVTQNSSALGFRGNEDLGMGLKAIFQIESGISFDSAATSSANTSSTGTGGPGTTTTTTGTSSTGFFASRNSNVGLSSTKLGTAFYGNWDTPYKSLTNTATFDSFYGTGIANDNALIGTPGFGVQSITASQRNGNASDASFDRRQGNSVQYWSPQLFGFSVRLAYSADEARVTALPPTLSATSATSTNINPTIYSASVAYEYGPFRVAYSFEQHRDYFGLTQMGGQVPGSANLGLNPTSRDNGNKVTLTYKLDTGLGTTTANVAWERLAYNNSETAAGAATDLIHYNRDLIYFAVKHQIGASTFRLGFGDARQGSCNRAAATSPCSTLGLDARQYAFGYSYSFSKRTDVYAFYTLTNNGEFASYQLANNAPITNTSVLGATAGPGLGGHQQGYGLGIRHVF
jgi:predicted porin